MLHKPLTSLEASICSLVRVDDRTGSATRLQTILGVPCGSIQTLP